MGGADEYMYSIGDKIVHPMHGAGVIEDIVEKCICGTLRKYYVFRVPAGSIMVMIPLGACETIGVRPVMNEGQAQDVLSAFGSMETEHDANWNKRYRDNMVRLKSGDLLEVSRVVKALMLREREHVLSTGERKMLCAAKQILLSELGLATGRSVGELEVALCGML